MIKTVIISIKNTNIKLGSGELAKVLKKSILLLQFFFWGGGGSLWPLKWPLTSSPPKTYKTLKNVYFGAFFEKLP